MNTTTRIGRLAVVGVLIFLCVNLTLAYGDNDADIRIVHAVPDAGQTDFYLNNIFAGTLNFGEAAQFIIVPPGEVVLRAVAPGAGLDGAPIFESTFTAGDDQTINAVLEGNRANINLGVYNVNRSPLQLGQSRVNVIHAFSGLDTAEFSIVAGDGSVAASGSLEFGANAAQEVKAGTYTLKLGDTLEKTLDFNAGTAYALVVIGAADGSQAADVRVFSGGTILGDSAGYVRFVHALPDAPSLDLYLDSTLVVPNMTFSESTVYVALPAGTYSAAFYSAGADPEGTSLFQVPVRVSDGTWITGLVTGDSAAPTLTPLIDDLSAVPEGESRLTVYNAEAEPAIVTIDGTALIDGLAPGTVSESVFVPTEPTVLTITSGADAALELPYVISPDTAFNLRTIILVGGTSIILAGCSLAPA